VERLFQPAEVVETRMLEAVCLGIACKAAGVYFFKRWADRGRSLAVRLGFGPVHRGRDRASRSGGGGGGKALLHNASDPSKPLVMPDSARDSNVQMVLVHMASEAASSVGLLLVASLGGEAKHFADAVVSLSISALIIYVVWPVCRHTALMLLQTTPVELRGVLTKALRSAAVVDGVLECHRSHFWTHAPGVYVGSLYIRCRQDADEQAVLLRVHSLFKPYITHITVQVKQAAAGAGGCAGAGAVVGCCCWCGCRLLLLVRL
jgi:Co/Zn/Cd efflux system component